MMVATDHYYECACYRLSALRRIIQWSCKQCIRFFVHQTPFILYLTSKERMLWDKKLSIVLLKDWRAIYTDPVILYVVTEMYGPVRLDDILIMVLKVVITMEQQNRLYHLAIFKLERPKLTRNILYFMSLCGRQRKGSEIIFGAKESIT